MVGWRYLNEDGRQTGRSQDFDDQTDAEAWLTSSWATLSEQGVESVELIDEGEVVYRMSLREESS